MASKRKKLTAGQRRAQLIEVGRKAFAELGYKGTSVEEIASRAGVSKPIVYEHFGGKEGLYAVIVDREMEKVINRITAAISEGDPRDRVEAAALAFLTYVKENADGFLILSQDSPIPGGKGTMSSLLNQVAERVGEVFKATLKQYGFNPKHAPIYAHALVGMVTFVGQWWVEEQKPSAEEVASHISALSWMGLRGLPRKPDKIG
jgi:AcrR family transcriptional regulator